jgi:hypothetical protein
MVKKRIRKTVRMTNQKGGKTRRNTKRKTKQRGGVVETVAVAKAVGPAVGAVGLGLYAGGVHKQYHRKTGRWFPDWEEWWHAAKVLCGQVPKYNTKQLGYIRKDAEYMVKTLGYDPDLVQEALADLMREAVQEINEGKEPTYNPEPFRKGQEALEGKLAEKEAQGMAALSYQENVQKKTAAKQKVQEAKKAEMTAKKASGSLSRTFFATEEDKGKAADRHARMKIKTKKATLRAGRVSAAAQRAAEIKIGDRIDLSKSVSGSDSDSSGSGGTPLPRSAAATPVPRSATATIISTETREGVDRKPFTIFRIEVTSFDGSSWFVEKRFSEFSDLRTALKAIDKKGGGLLAKQSFPSKQLFGSMAEKVVLARMKMLQSWLAVAVEHYWNADPLSAFLAGEGRRRTSTRTSSSSGSSSGSSGGSSGGRSKKKKKKKTLPKKKKVPPKKKKSSSSSSSSSDDAPRRRRGSSQPRPFGLGPDDPISPWEARHDK